MNLEVREVDGVFILTPHGMLLGGKETDELEEKVQELDGKGNAKLLINLSKTSYMSTMGVAALFKAYAKYTKRGATVKLCCVDDRIRQILVLTRLIMIFGEDVHETEDEALRSFKTMPAAVSP